MKSLNAAGRLYSQPWPEAALNLSQDVTGTGLPYLVQATNKPIVELYRQVSELMSRLITVLGDFADSNKDVQPVRELLVTNLKSVNAPKTVFGFKCPRVRAGSPEAQRRRCGWGDQIAASQSCDTSTC